MADHFRNRMKRFTELSQNVALVISVLLYPHVHEATSAPKTNTQEFRYQQHNFKLLQRERIILFRRFAIPN
ncbi:hypothetical protein TcasGA2_TC004595 [Tribolium castaneum]|uniref:Uncharacterized protein n=1 Tax=Tribolium castaneum TaxID=7070 RepID=D6W826_TRICA|nr:hypothetical protein TcasGA2_TC004595 [Tribolium castaneum]